jgi:hypothetical protein
MQAQLVQKRLLDQNQFGIRQRLAILKIVNHRKQGLY